MQVLAHRRSWNGLTAFAASTRGLAIAQVFEGFAGRIAIPPASARVLADALGTDRQQARGHPLQLRDRRNPARLPLRHERTHFDALDFTPSLTRRKANFAQFVHDTGLTNPSRARGLQRALAVQDYVRLVGDEAAPLGLRTDNLADALAIWWIGHRRIARGDAVPVGREAACSVRTRIAGALLADPSVSGASDAQKQESAEFLILQSAILEMRLSLARKRPKGMQALAREIRHAALGAGIDFDGATMPADTPAAGGEVQLRAA